MAGAEKHDGISPIHIRVAANAHELEDSFEKLWAYLVPESGRAQTAHGEMIRIAGRVSHEMMDNGCMNWDKDFDKMLKAFLEYAMLGVPLKNDAKAARKIVGILKKCAKNGYANEYMCAGLRECAVRWVEQNPNVRAPLEADYTR